MRKISIAVLSFLFVAGSFTLSSAQTVDEIIDTYLETIGGADAWKKVNSMEFAGKSSMQGMDFPVTVTSARPNLQKVEINVQGKQIVEAYDGENAWAINPFMGSMEPQAKTEEESKEAATNMFEDDLIDYKQKGHTLTLEGKEESEGTDCFKVKMVKADGEEMYHFFDTELYIPVMTRTFAKMGPMKGQAIETYVSDYDEVDGLIVPFSIEQKLGGQTFMQMTAESVKFNIEVADEFFAMPAGN